MVYDSARLSMLKNQDWHGARVNLEFLFEKHVSSEVETVYRLSEAFNQFGWSPILNLSTHYYLELVREFYANIVSKTNHSGELMESWVCGRRT